MSADHKYSLCNSGNLQQSIQMQLSHKEKALSQFFALFLKSTINFEKSEKKHEFHNLYIAKCTDCKRSG